MKGSIAKSLLWPLSFFVLSTMPAIADETPSAEQIARWVRDLGHERFSVRQAASSRLAKAGRPAFVALSNAAISDSLEVSDRAIRVLGQHLESPDRSTAKEVEKILTNLAAGDNTTAAFNARRALHAPLMKIVDQLEQGGAKVSFNDDRLTSVDLDNAKDLPTLLRLLHKLPDLESLSLSNAKMDDAGMQLLKGLPRLTKLNLYCSSIGDEGVKVLKTLPSLRSVPMGSTKVSDAGLVHLKDLTQLEYVGLRADNVTDAGLVHLMGLTNLTSVYLGETKVTAEGVAKLRKALPKLKTVTGWE